jgi:cyclopropane-fatty-acyl-phospholipid synthase
MLHPIKVTPRKRIRDRIPTGAMRLADVYRRFLDERAPLGFRAYDGSAAGPPGAPVTVVVRDPAALRYAATAPGELGLARAYVTGAIEVEGDLHEALVTLATNRRPEAGFRELLRALVGLRVGPRHRPPVPEEEMPASWRRGLARHTRRRDASVIAHHYDVSNRFYEMVLGPSMAYSCAVFTRPDATLEQAQAEKFDLVCRKLDLQPGQRLLDVGAGWGGMVRHAAEHYGVRALGVTLSREQAAWATESIAEAGLAARAEVRLLDYRDLSETGFDAISSIGAMEHFGTAEPASHFASMSSRLKPGGRMLNHCITRRTSRQRTRPGPFIERYVFPDGELQGVGVVITAMHDNGFEIRHEENLREHYAKTLREWGANLERNWTRAVAEVGERRARVWRLYMALSRVGFEQNRVQIHQMLGVVPDASGNARMPLRPDFRARTEHGLDHVLGDGSDRVDAVAALDDVDDHLVQPAGQHQRAVEP